MLVALMMVALLGIGAFAVDLGLSYAVKRQLSATADASALAGAQAAALEYGRLYPAGGGCTSTVVGEVAAVAGTAVAQTYAANAPQGSAGTPAPTITCDGASINVRVDTASNLNSLLGGVLGVTNLNPRESATAQVSGSPAYGGMRPFAVCIDDYPDSLTDAATTNQTIFAQMPKLMVSCNGNPPGNWGIVDFDGGSNPTADIENWTEFGYPGAVRIPSPPLISGDPGANVNPVADELDSIVGKTVLLPVASQWTDTGGNTGQFTTVGALGAQICGWGQKGSIGLTDSAMADSCWSDTKWAEAPDKATLVLQWRYTSYVSSYVTTGTGDAACSLAQQGCLAAIRLVE